MRIAILGGTGDIGGGAGVAAGPEAPDHRRIEGSGEGAGGGDAYNKRLKEKGMKDDIRGMTNLDATKRSDVVILAVKYQSQSRRSSRSRRRWTRRSW